MADIRDYIDWRGDISFAASPFCEVDNLVCCKLVALNYTDIVPETGEVPITEVCRRYIELHGDGDPKLGVVGAAGTVTLLRKLAASERYGGAYLCDYVNHVDLEREEQFSALNVRLPDGTRYVSFRGTDDTLVAWRENFNMSSMSSVPAQNDALDYLCATAWRYTEPLRVGGHSKGGNLSVYASVHAPEVVQDRLLGIYNNDGPGFLNSMRDTPQYQRILPRIHTYVPQYSLVGILLSHDDDFDIVESNETGISAHNVYTWQVKGTGIVRCEDFALRSRIFDEAISGWVNDMTMEQRAEFVDTLFDALGAAGAETLSDISEHKLRQALEIIKAVRSEPEQNKQLMNTLQLLLMEYAVSAFRAIPKPEVRLPRLPLRGRRRKDKALPEEAEREEEDCCEEGV